MGRGASKSAIGWQRLGSGRFGTHRSELARELDQQRQAGLLDTEQLLELVYQHRGSRDGEWSASLTAEAICLDLGHGVWPKPLSLTGDPVASAALGFDQAGEEQWAYQFIGQSGQVSVVCSSRELANQRLVSPPSTMWLSVSTDGRNWKQLPWFQALDWIQAQLNLAHP
jgi:hypothetical protein